MVKREEVYEARGNGLVDRGMLSPLRDFLAGTARGDYPHR
jgi:hypothetical protein